MSARSPLSGSRRESLPGAAKSGAEPAAGLLDDDPLAGQFVDHRAQDGVVAAVGEAHPDPRGAQVRAEVAEGPRLVDLAEQQRRGDAGVPEGADELFDLAEAQVVVGVDLAGEGGARLLVEADRDHPVAVRAQGARGDHGQFAAAGDQPDDAAHPRAQGCSRSLPASVNG